MSRVLAVVLALLLAFVVWGQTQLGGCPLCHAAGIPVPERDQLSKCECERWWNGQAPARFMFLDCSSKRCAQNAPDVMHDTAVFVDLQLYRCPHDGLLFTDPE